MPMSGVFLWPDVLNKHEKRICYIARFDDDFDGNFFSCEGGLYEIPYDYLYRLERFVRTADCVLR